MNARQGEREELEKKIAALARQRSGGKKRAPAIRPVLRRLEKARAALARYHEEGTELLPASAWLLDNFPYLEEMCQGCLAGGSGKKRAALPALQNGEARVYAIAALAVAQKDAYVDTDVLTLCARTFLRVQPLTMHELWSLPEQFKTALLVAAADCARECLQGQETLRKGESWAADAIAARGVTLPLPAALLSPLAAEKALTALENDEELHAALLQALREQDLSPEALLAAASEQKTQVQLVMSGAVRSLKRLEALDYAPVFEALSPVEAVLRSEPTGVYEAGTFETRERLRGMVGFFAKTHRAQETVVAKAALLLSRGGRDEQQRQVGYYLTVPAGMRQLSRMLGKPSFRFKARLFLDSHAKGIYFPLLWLLALAASAVLTLLANGGWTLFFLSLHPAFTLASRIASRLLAPLYPPKRLCRMEYAKGIPPSARTAVCIPALLSSPSRVKECAANLERCYLANRQSGLVFVLLGDFADHSAPEREDDQDILHAGMKAVHELNLRHGERFFFLCRPRRFSSTQGRYMGWERKRGALKQLNNAILTGTEQDFIAVNLPLDKLTDVKYVLTIDADTVLPPGTAAALAGTAAHPLNKGSALIAPRMESLPYKEQTRYGRLLTGRGGADTYSTVVTETYQDLFGEGIFGGKGIYAVRAFESATKRLPQNAILSHDLLEGLLCGAALASDIVLYERQPNTLRAWGARQHRWTRGDWQLLPFFAESGLSGLDRHKMADNLRRSLSPLYTVLCAVLFGWPGLVAMVFELGLPRFGGGRAWLTRLVLMPWQAFLQLSAAVVTLWRLLLTRKNLLQWVTAADMGDKTTLKPWRLWACWAAGVATALFSPLPVLAPVWLLAPLLPPYLEKQAHPAKATPPESTAFLRALAAKTYHWFEQALSPETHFLIPDNIQEQPGPVTALRTSPTNIGLSLCAHGAAYCLDLIPAPVLKQRAESTLSTLEKLETWQGQPLNWYNTATLEPLTPKVVSSVDNGNLAASLWMMAALLRTLGEHFVADRMERYVAKMDFNSLYDPARELLYISYDVAQGRYSGGHYDLFASEALLTVFLAVAKGDLPARCFRRLGRPMTRGEGAPVLLSWSGTMFEYLMPLLFLTPAPSSLMEKSAEGATKMQIAAAEGLRPFGESEAGYNGFDLGLNYQYKAFGLPALSMQGNPQNDVVVAPYAGALALLSRPEEATENLMRMDGLGWADEHGFYEAADYTRHPQEEPYTLIRSHMAHHQGMALLALENALGGKLRALFMARPQVAAHAVLLAEKAPVRVRARRFIPKRAELNLQPRARSAAYTASAGKLGAHPLSGGGTLVTVYNHGVGGARHGENALWRAHDADEGLLLYINGAPLRFTRAWHDTGVTKLYAAVDGFRVSLLLAAAPDDGSLLAELELASAAPQADAVVTVYFEPVLCPAQQDESHRAFADLFLQFEPVGEEGLLITRRPRGEEDPRSLTVLLGGDGAPAGLQSLRSAFLGRGEGQGKMRPAGIMADAATLSHTPVEPCAALSRRVELNAGQARLLLRVQPKAAPSARAEGLSSEVERGFALARLRARAEVVAYDLDAAKARLADGLYTALLFPARTAGERAKAATQADAPLSELWPLGLSGEAPMAAVLLRERESLPLARQAASLHALLIAKGFASSLLFIDDSDANYRRSLRGALEALSPFAMVLAGAELPAGRRAVLLARCGAVFTGGKGSFEQQLTRQQGAGYALTLPMAAFTGASAEPLPLPSEPLVDAGSCGGFTPDGASYTITATPPLAWSNVMANAHFGTLVTDKLAGYTFAGNARMFRLTPFGNDAVSDPYGEGVFLRDEASGQIDRMARRVTISQGWTRGEGGALGLYANAHLCVEMQNALPVKLWSIQLRNPGLTKREITLWAFARWVLGETTAQTAPSIQTGTTQGLLWARNRSKPDVPCAFLSFHGIAADAFSCDGRFLSGLETLPVAALDGFTGCGGEPAAILCARITLLPGESRVLGVMLGAAPSPEEAVTMLSALDPAQAVRGAAAYWENFLARCPLKLSDERLKRFATRWLPYQALSARFWGKTGFYQSGGAFGFRDQLQDAMMLGHFDPAILREHLLECAAHQFEEGDVQHWWHPPAHGVRTRISDDLLFLPWAAAEYIALTGDEAVLEARIPFLRAEPVPAGREDVYGIPAKGESGTLREHCMRAIRRASVFGIHGIPLMGSGDWNDAMNRVGLQGRGESTVVGWLLCLAIRRFLPFAPADARDGLAYTQAATASALEKYAYNGRWYIRAFYDDGTPMGEAPDSACRIDLVAQAMAVLSGCADPTHARNAINAAMDALYLPAKRMLRLLDPPFGREGDAHGRDAGYIAGYVPGVRENGGQYTHAAAWAALALLKLGDERGKKLLTDLLPDGRPEGLYKVEPYALAADIYAGDNLGRGGWTWYTGAAGWFWRALRELSLQPDAQKQPVAAEKANDPGL